jgi:hypothetical protein
MTTLLKNEVRNVRSHPIKKRYKDVVSCDIILVALHFRSRGGSARAAFIQVREAGMEDMEDNN